MKRHTFADDQKIACIVNCWLEDQRSKILLQWNLSFVETLDRGHFRCKKLRWKV